MSDNHQKSTSMPKGTPMILPEGIHRGKPRKPGPWKGYFINSDDEEVTVIVRYNLCYTHSGKPDKRKDTMTLREVFFLWEYSAHPIPNIHSEPTMDLTYTIPAVFAMNTVDHIKHSGWKMLLDELLPN
jgi:hypothetical protein